MSGNHATLLNFDAKNKMVLRLFWYLTIGIVLLQLIDFAYFNQYGLPATSTLSISEYAMSFLIRPALIILTIALIVSLLSTRRLNIPVHKYSQVLIVASVLLVNVIVMAHYGVTVVYVAYVFPIMLTLFYISLKLLTTAAICSFASYIFVAFVYLPRINPLDYTHGVIDISGTLLILISTTFFARYIILMHQQLIERLIEETVTKVIFEREVKEDSLTKLYNHATFYESLEFAIEGYKSSQIQFSTIMLDIDNFKSVNDTYGHDFGDVVLLRLVDIIKDCLEESDIAFRYGGEEFAVISYQNLDKTIALAEKIRLAFSEATYDEHSALCVTISAGVCTYSSELGSQRDFFSKVDHALYSAKTSGKNKVVSD